MFKLWLNQDTNHIFFNLGNDNTYVKFGTDEGILRVKGQIEVTG
mgnify:CR=1 FL=1